MHIFMYVTEQLAGCDNKFSWGRPQENMYPESCHASHLVIIGGT